MSTALRKVTAERAKTAGDALRCCRLCPRNCGANRLAGQTGFCGLDGKARCFREMLLSCEEEELNPSHQVYFAGCNLRCEFCSVSEWNEQPGDSGRIDMEELKQRIGQRQQEGARTLNFLGGEPAVSVAGILGLVSEIEADVPLVWNSNMYYEALVGELIEGVFDICLADLKCGNDDCANRLLGADEYFEVTSRNIIQMRRHSDVIVRHLVLPGHSDCCLKPILRWVASELPGAKVSLRGEYLPPARAAAAPAGYLTKEDLERARDLARDLELRLI